MFYYVYVLYSLKDKRLYIGQTNELQRRVREHWRGEVVSTSHRRPLKLIYFEGFLTRQESIRRELWLKSGAGRAELKRILALTLNTFGYKFR
ncbi:GIY-YIG nuclease family protein [Candidatus Uhrbacteria bacterium]|nr:GIY-YIG nuclease family protein [Candidatus Uhrbacteria bacterium]